MSNPRHKTWPKRTQVRSIHHDVDPLILGFHIALAQRAKEMFQYSRGWLPEGHPWTLPPT